MLPEKETVSVLRAIARQLGVARNTGVSHKALIIVGNTAAGDGNRADEIAHMVKTPSNVRRS